MKDLILYISKEIVENPEEISVEESTDETGLLTYLISVNPDDMGRIIGKEGKTIGAIRSLVRVAARKQGKRVRVDLKEPEGRTKPEEQVTSLEPSVEEKPEE